VSIEATIGNLARRPICCRGEGPGQNVVEVMEQSARPHAPTRGIWFEAECTYNNQTRAALIQSPGALIAKNVTHNQKWIPRRRLATLASKLNTGLREFQGILSQSQ